MMKYSALLFFFFTQTVFAGPYCLQTRMDYERRCADVSSPNRMPTLRNPNDCAIVNIASQSRWNASNLRLEANKKYTLEVIGGRSDKWCDASVVTDYQGWDIEEGGNKPGSMACPAECEKCRPRDAVAGPHVNLGVFGNIVIKASKLLRRQPDRKLFALIGFVKGEGYEEIFNITNSLEFSPRRDAEFCAYANDVSFFYGNNSGSLQLKISYTGNN